MPKSAQQIVLAFTLSSALLAPEHTYAVDKIKVLLARNNSGIPATLIRDALEDANFVMDQTFDGLPPGRYEFESATPTMQHANCADGPRETVILCAQSELAARRTQYDADVVVMAVNDITDDSASVPPAMINRPFVSHDNEHLAFVIVDKTYLVPDARDRLYLAHELTHILSIEHHDGDPATDFPAVFPGLPLALVCWRTITQRKPRAAIGI